MKLGHAPITNLVAEAYTIPTQQPESDGTLEWDSTTMVLAQATGGGVTGIGYTYANAAAATYINRKLEAVVRGCNAFSIAAAWRAMWAAVRNDGQCGLAAMAVSAVDCALWDLKAKLLKLPLIALLQPVRDAVRIYGSGGFTSYDERALSEQLSGWVREGITHVKMKVGRKPDDDPQRVAAARKSIGDEAVLMVDANGAYSRTEARRLGNTFAHESNVTWFEEPLPAHDLRGLQLLRRHVPPQLKIAGGEYGYRLADFRMRIEAGAVDCLMADATRCGGITGFLRVSRLCEAHNVPLSAHTAPALHLHVACACTPLRHVEWFHDHARIERMLFDGSPEPNGGRIAPDLSRPGIGIQLKRCDAQPFRVNV